MCSSALCPGPNQRIHDGSPNTRLTGLQIAVGDPAERDHAVAQGEVGRNERHGHAVRAKNCGRCARWASSSASRSGTAMS